MSQTHVREKISLLKTRKRALNFVDFFETNSKKIIRRKITTISVKLSIPNDISPECSERIGFKSTVYIVIVPRHMYGPVVINYHILDKTRCWILAPNRLVKQYNNSFFGLSRFYIAYWEYLRPFVKGWQLIMFVFSLDNDGVTNPGSE